MHRIAMAGVSVTLVLALAGVSAAQQFTPSTNPVADSVRQSLAQHSKHLIASAELMPAEKYSYHPTDAQMTFGKLVVHIVQTNSAICSAFGGTPDARVFKLSDTEPKDTLVAALKQSFTFCSDALAKVNDASLGEEAVMMGKPTRSSRAMAMVIIVADWADHYSTAAGYLRLNGILPPSAQPKKLP